MFDPAFVDVVCRVEECLNRRMVAKSPVEMKTAAPQPLPMEAYQRFEEALARRRRAATAVDVLYKLLPERGYALPDGTPDTVNFYKAARISPDVWSTFVSRKHAPSKDTLMKIVLTLRLSEAEAADFLHTAGAGFNPSDLTDQVVLACLELGYYDPETVWSLLEVKGARNIYGKAR